MSILKLGSMLCVVSCLSFTAVRAPLRGDELVAARPGETEKVSVYDEKADAKEQISRALARARKDNRRVLVQWGGNWCSWCLRLHGLYKSNQDVAQKLLYEYETVFVDAGRPAGKNVELAASYGADLKTHGYPFLTVLDTDGKAIANQETSSLENKDQAAQPGHDPAKVLAFLTKHQPARIRASKVLEGALARARTEKKQVFLHLGAPWCGWCRRLDIWLEQPEVARIIEKAFIETKIDMDRNDGSKEVAARFPGSTAGGIPWFAFLDAEGKVVADSTGPKGNVGFPQAPGEIDHFESMLKKSGTLGEQEIRSLRLTLEKKPVKSAE